MREWKIQKRLTNPKFFIIVGFCPQVIKLKVTSKKTASNVAEEIF